MQDLELASLLPSWSLTYLRNLVFVVFVMTVAIYTYTTLKCHSPSWFKLQAAQISWGSCVSSKYPLHQWWLELGSERLWWKTSLSQVPTAQKKNLHSFQWVTICESLYLSSSPPRGNWCWTLQFSRFFLLSQFVCFLSKHWFSFFS